MVQLSPSMDGADGEDCLHFGHHIDREFCEMRGQRVFEPMSDSFDIIHKALPIAERFGPQVSVRMLQKPIEQFMDRLLRHGTNNESVIPSSADTLYVKDQRDISTKTASHDMSRDRVIKARLYADKRVRGYRQLTNDALEKVWRAHYHEYLNDNPSGT